MNVMKTTDKRMNFLGKYYTCCPSCKSGYEIDKDCRYRKIFCDTCGREFEYQENKVNSVRKK